MKKYASFKQTAIAFGLLAFVCIALGVLVGMSSYDAFLKQASYDFWVFVYTPNSAQPIAVQKATDAAVWTAFALFIPCMFVMEFTKYAVFYRLYDEYKHLLFSIPSLERSK